MKRVTVEDYRRGRREAKAHAAGMAGIILSCLGWAIFTCSLIFVEYGSERSAMMVLAGVFIVPGWVLLRYSGGLFPFGPRIFGWERRE